jgi:hypothetical protein
MIRAGREEERIKCELVETRKESDDGEEGWKDGKEQSEE